MKRYTVLSLLFLIGLLSASAQIGYQVALLNQADGTPRANETVTVEITITNAEGTKICSEEKSATTDEFGILSLTIGNSKTFETVDFNKLPFFISATVDGVLIGKTQMLNVPVAEYAKRTGVLTREFLNGTKWKGESEYEWHPHILTFNDKQCTWEYDYTLGDIEGPWEHAYNVYDYEIVDNQVILHRTYMGTDDFDNPYTYEDNRCFLYIPSLNILVSHGDGWCTFYYKTNQ